MKEFIAKADVLVEALPYIQRFRDAAIVVKCGGSVMEDREHTEGLLEDITFMECVGMRPLIVHGGGKAISRSMGESGIASSFLHGLRVTCEKSIEVVENVLMGEVNPGIVKTLEGMGARAKGVHGADVFRVRRMSGVDPVTGEELDWGFVGEPQEVITGEIERLLEANIIPVITPIGLGPDGKKHNINADTAAAAVAKALKVRKLAFLSDVPGLLRDPENPDSLIHTLHVSEVETLIKDGTISGGMLPKVKSCLEALAAGVCKIHMIDGRMQHSLLLEIFTDSGVGTEIIHNEQ